MSLVGTPLERLRKIWSPSRDVAELFADLNPQTELDSMIRDYLHRTLQQKGPVTLVLENNGLPVMNSGTLRWEIIHHEVVPGSGIVSRREVSLWVEKEGI